jgi:hypothetical protein
MRWPLLFCLLLCGWPAVADDAAEPPTEERKACLMPHAPAILDGRSARKEQITEMREAVVAFIGDNMAYRNCLEAELKLLGGMSSQKARDLKAYIDEAILDSLEMDDLVADTFNTQLRIYKSLQQ